MAKSANQKLKLLILKDYLLRNSDEKHPVTIPQIIEELGRYDIKAERKSIYDDLEALRVYGMDIVQRKGNYYVGERNFQTPELKLLVDSIQSSKFITQKKTMSLIKKLEELASMYDAQLLERQVYVRNRVKKTVRCPQCGKETEFTMWQSINNEMFFAMKDIISGKLFEVECKKCGKIINVNYPILVNDMAHRVMIYYTFPDGKVKTEKALELTKKLYDGRVRIVTDQASLKEKVAIFNADLDDRIIELLKAIVIAQIQDQLGNKEVYRVYFIPDDNPRFEIIYDGGSGYVAFDMESYDKIKDEFVQVEDFAKDTEPYINLDWAYSILSAGYEE